MRKDQNRSENRKLDVTLPRSRILRGKKNFERLFQRSTLLTQSAIQFRYRIYPDSSEGSLVGFLVPKRIVRGAVQRNRMKRWLREAYRTNQHILNDVLTEASTGFHALFMIRKPAENYSVVKEEVVLLLNKAVKNLENRRKRKNKTEDHPAKPTCNQ